MTKPTAYKNQRPLLVTLTKEPFQPVRLYYRIPPRPDVLAKLRGLACMAEDPFESCWQWLYHGETKSLRFARSGYDDVPTERQPMILGRIRFPKSGGMTLQTNSAERAIQAARFFALCSARGSWPRGSGWSTAASRRTKAHQTSS